MGAICDSEICTFLIQWLNMVCGDSQEVDLCSRTNLYSKDREGHTRYVLLKVLSLLADIVYVSYGLSEVYPLSGSMY